MYNLYNQSIWCNIFYKAVFFFCHIYNYLFERNYLLCMKIKEGKSQISNRTFIELPPLFQQIVRQLEAEGKIRIEGGEGRGF